MTWQIYSETFLFIIASIFLVVKLRHDGGGKIDTRWLGMGIFIIATITFLLPLAGITAKNLGPLGRFIFYIGIPVVAYLTYHYKPEVFQMREKVISWVILGTLLVMAVGAMSGCGHSNKTPQEIERQRDLPDLEKSKQGGVNPYGSGGNNNK